MNIIKNVEGKKLTNLPNSKKKLPEYLDKNYGINKKYELTNLSDIDSYTIYYVLNYNDEVYYTDVVYEINEYEGELKPDAESKELVWVPIDKLPDNIMATQIENIEKFVSKIKNNN